MSTKQEQQLLKIDYQNAFTLALYSALWGKRNWWEYQTAWLSQWDLWAKLFNHKLFYLLYNSDTLPKTQEWFKTRHLCYAISWLLLLNQTWPDQCCIPFPARQHSSSFNTSTRSSSFLSHHRIMTLKCNTLWTFFAQIHPNVPAPCITDNSKDDTQRSMRDMLPYDLGTISFVPSSFEQQIKTFSYCITIY